MDHMQKLEHHSLLNTSIRLLYVIIKYQNFDTPLHQFYPTCGFFFICLHERYIHWYLTMALRKPTLGNLRSKPFIYAKQRNLNTFPVSRVLESEFSYLALAL